jgi:hypothetical protein
MSIYESMNFVPVYVVQIPGRQDGLFRAHKGKRLIAAHRKPGNIPFVGASRVNNSITDFAATTALFPGGWVTLIYNGDGGTGHARYQPVPFSASDDVIALEPISDDASPSALILIAKMLTHQCVSKFGFGYKLTLHRLSRQKVMVPMNANSDGEVVVDWDGMRMLGEELIAKASERTSDVRMSDLKEEDETPILIFRPMLITDVFQSMASSSAWYDKTKLKTIGPACYPFITRTSGNNGIGALCGRQDKNPEPGNAITIGLDTQTIAYQPVPFYTSQNIQVLRHNLLNCECALILVAIIKQQMSKFGWGGNGATLGRLKQTRIMVPVTTSASGEQVADWDGMRRYGEVIRAKAECAMNVPLAKNWGMQARSPKK